MTVRETCTACSTFAIIRAGCGRLRLPRLAGDRLRPQLPTQMGRLRAKEQLAGIGSGGLEHAGFRHEQRQIDPVQDGDYHDVLASALYAPHKDKAHVVLMSALTRPDDYQEARRAGIFDVVGLPCRPTNLEWAIILAKRDERNHARELVGIPSSSPARARVAVVGVR